MSTVKRITFNAATGTTTAVDVEQTPAEIAAEAAAADSAAGAVTTGLSVDYGNNGSRSQRRSPVSHRAIKMGTPVPNGTLNAIVDGVPVKLVIEAPTK
jgi:hypothetical protein